MRGVPFRPGLALSHEATDFNAESWCGVKMVMELPPRKSFLLCSRGPPEASRRRSIRSLCLHAHASKQVRGLFHPPQRAKAMFVLAILKAMRRKSAYFSSHVTLTCMLTLSVPASIGTGAAEAIGAAARFSK